jgi:phosphohistidine phosphatase
MKLFVLRHGMTTQAETDAERDLTPEGVTEVENVLKLRLDEMKDITAIYSSPLRRVKQTLYIARRMLNYRGDIIDSPYLKTASRLPEIEAFAGELDPEGGDVLVSSHQSCTSILVLWLTGEDVIISTGSLLCIDVKSCVRGGGDLLWQESHNSREIKRTSDFIDQI